MSACGSSLLPSLSDTTSSAGSTTSNIPSSYFSYDSNTSYQQYTVTFVTNATTTLDPIVTSIIETMPLVENDPLTLEGWFFDISLTEPVNFPLFVDRDMTLYAKWVEASPGFIFKPTLDGLGYIVEAYIGNAVSLAIQATYNGKPVHELGEYLFYNNGALLSVVLPNQLRVIGMAAFKGATQLATITIPNTVTDIKTDAFSGAIALSNISLSTSLINIGNNAFENLPNLVTVDIPASISDIRSRAFADNPSLTTVVIRATTPPLRFPNSFENTPTNLIYRVPSSALNTYKTNEFWAAFAWQIASI